MPNQNPNDRQHRPFVLDGEYPAPPAEDAFSEDPFMAEQDRRQQALKHESGPLYGDYPRYPDRATPRDPATYAREQDEAEYLRACHGGLPDAPVVIRPGNAKPWKGMKG